MLGRSESPANRSQRKRGRGVPYKRGYFLELRALAAALFSRSFTLAKLAGFLDIEHGKLETDHHGKPLTPDEAKKAIAFIDSYDPQLQRDKDKD